MTLNFPAEPADGDIYLNYVYDATEGVWNANPRQLASRFVTSATTPAEPSNGDGWFNTTNGKTYIFYYDGTSGQWIESGYPVLGYQTLENLSDTTIATPTNGQVLKYNGSDWINDTDNVGKILQVVSTTKTDSFEEDVPANAISANNVTGLTVTITPASSSNKILLRGTIMLGNSIGIGTSFAVFRDNAALTGATGDADGSRSRLTSGSNSGTSMANSASFEFLDSPATTSAVTYSIRLHHDRNSEMRCTVNKSGIDTNSGQFGRYASTITAMEVAG